MVPPCSSAGTAARDGRLLRPELVCACLAFDLISVRNENPAGELPSGRSPAREGVHLVTRSLLMKPTDQTSLGVRLTLSPSSSCT